MRRLGASCLVVLGIASLAACGGGQKDQVTLEFATQAALDHTNIIAVTAFEPILREPDSDDLEFVSCPQVGPFPPVRRLNPDTLSLSNLLGRVLKERDSESFPLDGDWGVSFDPPDADNANNPWGAVMVLIEARGDARASERGAGQVAATLASGCYCFRTRDDGFADSALRSLDQQVRKACPLLTDPEQPEERVVSLEPVVPAEFHLRSCDGVTNLTTPKNALITPGPQVCLQTVRCDDVVAPQDCFRCEQPCDELDDMSNAPIVFTVNQPGGDSQPQSQVVLTSLAGQATASIQVDDCSRPIEITAQLLGRTADPVRFEVSCVEPVAELECTTERNLAEGYEAKSVATVPSPPGACAPGFPERCDQIAVLYEESAGSLLEVRGPQLAIPVQIAFPQLRAHAVHSFLYEIGSKQRPVVVAVLTDPNLIAQIYVYEWRDGQLVPHDGVDGLLRGRCPWFESCNSGVTCTDTCANDTEVCVDGSCRIAQTCWPQIQLQSQVTIAHRDLDRDGRADLAIGNSGELPLVFFYSAQAGPDALYASQGCACGRFGQAPNAFALANMGGAVPDPSVSDIVLGSAGGSFLKYAASMVGGPALTCGQSSPLGDGMSVRDVRSATFGCRPDDLTCQSYGDAVIVSARGISGGSLDEPGFIRVLYGTSNDLSVGGDVLDIPGISLGLVPSAFADRGEPRDPRNAQISDFNGDGHEDLAVLYKASEEVHIWLGASNRALGELERGAVLETCAVSLDPGSRCAPLPSFATPDLDGDGRAEVAVICDPMGSRPRVRYFKAQAQ